MFDLDVDCYLLEVMSMDSTELIRIDNNKLACILTLDNISLATADNNMFAY